MLSPKLSCLLVRLGSILAFIVGTAGVDYAAGLGTLTARCKYEMALDADRRMIGTATGHPNPLG